MRKYLLLLNHVDKSVNTEYKGIFRAGLFRNNLIQEENHILKEYWFKALEKTDENGFFESQNEAIETANQFKVLGEIFEIVECAEADRSEEHYEKNFLGYDVCDKNLHSLIFWYGYDRFPNLPIHSNNENIMEYLSLYYHSSKLNSHKLFDNYQDASLFLQTQVLLNDLYPCHNQLHILAKNDCFIYKLHTIAY